MIFEKNSSYNIFFGDKGYSVNPDGIRYASDRVLFAHETLGSVLDQHAIRSVTLVHQVHGIQGMHITSCEQAQSLQLLCSEGDYLITNQKNSALGVLTADCLPLVIYDKQHHAVGIAHAGWRGSVAGIAGVMLRHMTAAYGTVADQVECIPGPCAGVCCYQVGIDFVEQLSQDPRGVASLKKLQKSWFFDNLLYNQLCLLDEGVAFDQWNTEGVKCTMENENYWSFRREKTHMRNISLVTLK